MACIHFSSLLMTLLLVCLLSCLLACSLACLLACFLVRLLAWELVRVLGSLNFIPWRLLESSVKCSGAPHDCLRGSRIACEAVWGSRDRSRRPHDHEMLYPSLFWRLPGSHDFPGTGSRSAPGDAPGSLACVSNDYSLVFREPCVFRGA